MYFNRVGGKLRFFLFSFSDLLVVNRHSALPFRTIITTNEANEQPHLCKSVKSVASASHQSFCLKLALGVKNINPEFIFLVRFSYLCNYEFTYIRQRFACGLCAQPYEYGVPGLGFGCRHSGREGRGERHGTLCRAPEFQGD